MEEIGGNTHFRTIQLLNKNECKSLGLVLSEGLQWRGDSSPDPTSLGIHLTYFECNVISQPRANARPNK